jgi:hypothetical protein
LRVSGLKRQEKSKLREKNPTTRKILRERERRTEREGRERRSFLSGSIIRYETNLFTVSHVKGHSSYSMKI